MSFAHVESVDALKQLRAALWKFVEASNQSLSEAEADLQKTLNWLEHEARSHWQAQIQRRTADVNRAREAVRAKKSLTRKDGTRPSAVEEEKALGFAEQRLHDAEAKLEKVRHYARVLQREALQYRGLMQRFVMAVQSEAPDAAGHLDLLIRALEGYTEPAEAGSVPQAAASQAQRSSDADAASMTRAEPADAEALDASGERPHPPAAEPPRQEER